MGEVDLAQVRLCVSIVENAEDEEVGRSIDLPRFRTRLSPRLDGKIDRVASSRVARVTREDS